jgi:hypothetical protein
MGALFALAVGFLLGVGVLDAVVHGTIPFRHLGVGAVLTAFGVGFYRRWGSDGG